MDLALNTTTGDLDLTQGGHMLTGNDATRQRITRRLRKILGEWVLDIRVGIDYFGQIFVKNLNINVVRSMYLRCLKETAGVGSVDSIQLTGNTNRELLVSFIVTTITGEKLVFKEFIP